MPILKPSAGDLRKSQSDHTSSEKAKTSVTPKQHPSPNLAFTVYIKTLNYITAVIYTACNYVNYCSLVLLPVTSLKWL